jgi:hypothetical protein
LTGTGRRAATFRELLYGNSSTMSAQTSQKIGGLSTMISARKIKANRENARASTGPRTANGRARSAKNALRHALSLPVCSDPALSKAVEALALEIAGADALMEIQESHAKSPMRKSIFAECAVRAITLLREVLAKGPICRWTGR